MWASLGFLCLGQSFTGKTGKQEPSHSSLYLSSLFTTLTLLDLIFPFIISCPSLSLSPFSLKLSLTCFLPFISSTFLIFLLSFFSSYPSNIQSLFFAFSFWVLVFIFSHHEEDESCCCCDGLFSSFICCHVWRSKDHAQASESYAGLWWVIQGSSFSGFSSFSDFFVGFLLDLLFC